MKVDSYYQQQNYTECTFQRCIDYADVARRSSAMCLQLQYSGRKMHAIFKLYTQKYLANDK